MKTITCLINDAESGTANPLIYTVEVNNPESEAEVMDAVFKERCADLGFDEDDADELDLTLLVAFDGDCKIAADWRY